MGNNASIALLLTALAVTTQACGTENVASELSRIGAETSVLKARAKQLEVQAAIAGKQAEIDRLRADRAQGGGDRRPALPRLLAVEGLGSRMYATLAFENQGVLEVKEGDVLPNGMHVASIQLNEVVLAGKGRTHARIGRGVAPAPLAAPNRPAGTGVPADVPMGVPVGVPIGVPPGRMPFGGAGSTERQ